MGINASPQAASIDATERQWATDMASYKEMRRQGLQPKQIDGSHILANEASTVTEVETGQLLTKKQRADVRALTDGQMAS